ncbi:Cobalt-zinc-cadmium resistance protein CzcB [Anatilimnocola aggregata]|uniref:Cobalt-zinc-cadmium resistance protein CzcB n=1 Tax=Anatilimnocola aggregata TaxID=2528021 RepID=A0A517YE24_9BACT|nr:efflux RND transporter periplasmic adaptor subunit [Anatilimnocola aggregata]QDU28467.1 Cobalt-zinc-cadmium resistance protein CzcB [Anatilimnocola aggregata]
MHNLPLLLTALLAIAAEPETIEISSAVIKVVEDVAVSSSEAGLVAKLSVREGQMVKEGEPLAQLLDSAERLALERARLEAEIAARKATNEINVRYAKKSTEVARAELARSEETNLKYPKTVSDSELDRQRLVRERGDLEVKQAEHELEIATITQAIRDNERHTAQEMLDRRTIRAPLQGMVVELHRRPGEWVQPGETVARVLRLDRLRVEGFMAAKHAQINLVGSKATVRVAGADGKARDFPGEVVFVSPEIDPINSQVRIWAEVNNKELLLRPGMTASLLVEGR